MHDVKSGVTVNAFLDMQHGKSDRMRLKIAGSHMLGLQQSSKSKAMTM